MIMGMFYFIVAVICRCCSFMRIDLFSFKGNGERILGFAAFMNDVK